MKFTLPHVLMQNEKYKIIQITSDVTSRFICRVCTGKKSFIDAFGYFLCYSCLSFHHIRLHNKYLKHPLTWKYFYFELQARDNMPNQKKQYFCVSLLTKRGSCSAIW